MKFAYCLLTVFCMAAVCSCTDKEVQAPQVNSNSLPGAWEIRGLWGALIDVDPNSFKPGNGNIWSFSGSLFSQRDKDSVYNSGVYSVSNTGFNPVENRTVNRFIFNGASAESFELLHDTLFVFSIRTDQYGYEAVYVKVSDDTTGYSLH